MTPLVSVPNAVRWWRVFNPAIYLVSILPALTVLFWSRSNPVLVMIGSLAVALIQHCVNLQNDVLDWERGADSQKSDSWIHWSQGNIRKVKTTALTFLVLGVLMGVFVILTSQKNWLFLHAFVFVTLGLCYNRAKNPLAYGRWGEWVTGLCYGPGVFIGLWALSGAGLETTYLIVGSVMFFCLSLSVLLSHQPPQILTDLASAKSSFAVRYGATTTRRTSLGLFAVFSFLWFFFIPFNFIQMAATGACLSFVFRETNPKTVLLSALVLIALPLIFAKGGLF